MTLKIHFLINSGHCTTLEGTDWIENISLCLFEKNKKCSLLGLSRSFIQKSRFAGFIQADETDDWGLQLSFWFITSSETLFAPFCLLR